MTKKPEEKLAKDLAFKLYKLRKEKGLSQFKIAVEADVSLPMYVRWEHGKTIPGTLSLIKLCLYFNISADFLLGLKEATDGENYRKT